MRTLMIVTMLTAAATAAEAQNLDTVNLRGHAQTVRLFGTRGGPPVIVTSGDGGWMHLGPHVAAVLAAKGFLRAWSGSPSRRACRSWRRGGRKSIGRSSRKSAYS